MVLRSRAPEIQLLNEYVHEDEDPEGPVEYPGDVSSGDVVPQAIVKADELSIVGFSAYVGASGLPPADEPECR